MIFLKLLNHKVASERVKNKNIYNTISERVKIHGQSPLINKDTKSYICHTQNNLVSEEPYSQGKGP